MLPEGLQSLPAAPLTLQRPALKHFLSKNVCLYAQMGKLREAMFRCRFMDPCLTGLRVKISNHVFFPLVRNSIDWWGLSGGEVLPAVACHPGIGSGGRVIEYRSLPGPADTEVM